MPTPLITLASASPRRRELLDQILVSYEVLPVDIDESLQPGETAGQYVKRLALQKAQAGFQQISHRPALGSDTAVVMGERILGKPTDQQMAFDMLSILSGKTHQVVTAVAICNSEVEYCVLSTSEVKFTELSSQQIDDYLTTGEFMDKAGAYGIQGVAAQFIKNINGSYSGIMGLPLFETAELLKMTGIQILSR